MIHSWARFARRIATGVDDSPQVLVAVSTTTANDVDAKFSNEVAGRCGPWLRFRGIDRQAIDVERKARVGNGRDGQRAVFCQETHRLAHMFGPSRAIQPDHIDSQSDKRRHYRGDVGAEQHAPAGVERNLRLYGDDTSYLPHGVPEPGDYSPPLPNVLPAFDHH